MKIPVMIIFVPTDDSPESHHLEYLHCVPRVGETFFPSRGDRQRTGVIVRQVCHKIGYIEEQSEHLIAIITTDRRPGELEMTFPEFHN